MAMTESNEGAVEVAVRERKFAPSEREHPLRCRTDLPLRAVYNQKESTY